jgi:hypothetical protein
VPIRSSAICGRREFANVPEEDLSMTNDTLINAYRQIGVPLDRLPYSEAFARLRDLIRQLTGESIEYETLWKTFLRIRKDGQLPRLMR